MQFVMVSINLWRKKFNTMKFYQLKIINSLVALALAITVSSCALLTTPFILGATAVGVTTKVILDKRSTGAQIEDNTIEFKLGSKISQSIPNANINVTTFNRVVLLTGEAPNENERQNAEKIAKEQLNVRGVFNYLTVGPSAGFVSRTGDSTITGKVKTALIAEESVKARDIKVVTEDSVVYMFGIVLAQEAEVARKIAGDVSGVKKVVTLFEIQTGSVAN